MEDRTELKTKINRQEIEYQSLPVWADIQGHPGCLPGIEGNLPLGFQGEFFGGFLSRICRVFLVFLCSKTRWKCQEKIT